MYELKPLHREAIPAALAKAEKYRVLNQPAEAESICLDVLLLEPEDMQATTLLLLALTDQFPDRSAPIAWKRAQELVDKLHGEYEPIYYQGLIWERRAKARLQQGGPGAADVAVPWLREAMTWYEKAEKLRPIGNDDALLRWNACVRTLEHLPVQAPDERDERPHE
jgi:hypothetical protein